MIICQVENKSAFSRIGLGSKYDNLQPSARSHSLALLSGQRVIIASHNPGKVREMRAILAPFKLNLVAAAEMQLEEPTEDGDTFAANAVKKAVEIAAWLNDQPLDQARPDFVLADDSGLTVDALDGQPGVRSARYARGDGLRARRASSWPSRRKQTYARHLGNLARHLSLRWTWPRGGATS